MKKTFLKIAGLFVLAMFATSCASTGKQEASAGNEASPEPAATGSSAKTVIFQKEGIMDQACVGPATFNEDGSVTYDVQAQYSGGGYVWYINSDQSIINLQNYESVDVELDFTPVEGKWAAGAANPKWLLRLYPAGANFWNGGIDIEYFSENKYSGTTVYNVKIPEGTTGDVLAAAIKLNAYESGNRDSDTCTVTIKKISFNKKAGAGEDKPEDDGLLPEERGSIVQISYSTRDYTNGTSAAYSKPANVYLPAGYDPADKDTLYPVLYLLHGIGGNENEWGMTGAASKVKKIMDKLVKEDNAQPFIIVTPNGRSCENYTNTGFDNMYSFYTFSNELRNDLIPFMEENFNVATGRDNRAIAGLSMGGMQTINCGLCECLDLFSWFGAFSAAPTSNEAAVIKEKVEAFDEALTVSYFYNICGTEDSTALASATAAAARLPELCGRFVDGDNFAWVTMPGTHDWPVWYKGFENFAQIIFK